MADPKCEVPDPVASCSKYLPPNPSQKVILPKRKTPRMLEGKSWKNEFKVGGHGTEDDEELDSWQHDLHEYEQYEKRKARMYYSGSSDSDRSEGDQSESEDLDDDLTESSASDEDKNERGGPKKGSGRKASVANRKSSTVPAPPPGAPKSTKRRPTGANRWTDKELEGMTLEFLDTVKLLRARNYVHPVEETPSIESENLSFHHFRHSYEFIKSRQSVEAWAEDLSHKIQEDPVGIMLEHFVECFRSKLRKQMKKEWFYWARVGEDGLQPQLYFCWKTVFRDFVLKHPVWKEHSGQLEFHEMVQEVGLACMLKIQRLISFQSKIIQRLYEWRKTVEEAMQNKLACMRRFRELETEIASQNKKLDEFCHWGKKKLQSVLRAPYFKLSNRDYTNLIAPQYFLQNIHGIALIIPKKQKWTTKDTLSLKKIISEVIVDREYTNILQKYNYLISRINYGSYERQSSIAPSSSRNNVDSESFVNNLLGVTHKSKDSKTKRIPYCRSMEKKRLSTAGKNDFSKTTIVRAISVENLDKKIEVRAHQVISNQDLQLWRQRRETELRKLDYEGLMKEKKYVTQIDWSTVAERLTLETGKDRSPSDCRLVWLHDARPSISNKRWPVAHIKKLMELGKKVERMNTMAWTDVAEEIEHRTPYQCFFKYRNRSIYPDIMKWDARKDRLIKDVLINEGPKWGKAVEATQDHRATKHQVQERWKKFCNPMIRNGAFTRVEDALLLLSIEKLRGFVYKECHFGIFISYLPWRYENVWRDRASNLFSNWIVPWTIQEDRKLLQLADAQVDRKNWTKISEEFSSFKNRKGCLTRYKILKSKIGPPAGKFLTLEEYHEAYSMTRYNIFQYKHLKEVVELLRRISSSPKPSQPFPGLKNDRQPMEVELRWMLLDYDRMVIDSALSNLKVYMETRDSYWKDWTEENGERRKTFDRRTFHRDVPKSVASAVHIQGLLLIPQDEVEGDELTPFELEVYFHYVRFRRTKALSSKARPYLPSAHKLVKLPEIRRIAKLPDHLQNVESASDWEDTDRVGSGRRRGRPSKNTNISCPRENVPLTTAAHSAPRSLSRVSTAKAKYVKKRKLKRNMPDSSSDESTAATVTKISTRVPKQVLERRASTRKRVCKFRNVGFDISSSSEQEDLNRLSPLRTSSKMKIHVAKKLFQQAKKVPKSTKLRDNSKLGNPQLPVTDDRITLTKSSILSTLPGVRRGPARQSKTIDTFLPTTTSLFKLNGRLKAGKKNVQPSSGYNRIASTESRLQVSLRTLTEERGRQRTRKSITASTIKNSPLLCKLRRQSRLVNNHLCGNQNTTTLTESSLQTVARRGRGRPRKNTSTSSSAAAKSKSSKLDRQSEVNSKKAQKHEDNRNCVTLAKSLFKDPLSYAGVSDGHLRTLNKTRVSFSPVSSRTRDKRKDVKRK